MSDVDVMSALIQQHAEAFSAIGRNYIRITDDSAQEAAQALYDAGFRMMANDINQAQNARLAELERRMGRIEGWAGLPQ
ncbi:MULTISPECIES: hypothetical protein [Mycobacteroides]|jgi:hypothetical protein|uniref:hypothetical protein n=1 Tax=Mycobacteroides TaxID=670516 RepID=UPI00092CB979|nr:MULTISPECIES: hypothetical protein [Mycobacteroides]MBV6360495.1 hypothetical protein [Mycobacteroides chelonae]SHW94730.1 Uncharacterised protein [Mycobacteroides abscessus subsp. abscessus]SKL78474.1 Uncharacterised protein [Mycobacteroides abscessus subsp. abscessus]SKM54425.1 Uncharacterised protein [Mycobacteroides abscessus subsp. abscessus]SLK35275.1 Uncharacterised protein [Mycobacteroides abscessus subsp. abscessus]